MAQKDVGRSKQMNKESENCQSKQRQSKYPCSSNVLAVHNSPNGDSPEWNSQLGVEPISLDPKSLEMYMTKCHGI